MPSIVRVKRRIDEEPLSAFVLNSKKRRLEDGSGQESSSTEDKNEISTVLKFAGTIENQDDTATKQMARLNREAAKDLVQQKMSRKPQNPTERSRAEMRHSTQENRFRVVNCLRTPVELTEADIEEIRIVDIEKQEVAASTNTKQQPPKTVPKAAPPTDSTVEAEAATPSDETTGEAMALASEEQHTDSDTGYVYDLYLPENEEQAMNADLMDDNHLSVRALDRILFDDRANNDDDDSVDSEDSNRENYYSNDYPDEDDEELDDGHEPREDSDEEELCSGVKRFFFDNEDEMDDSDSSDDMDVNAFRDPYVHDAEEDFAEDVDAGIAARYGHAYAVYRARILKRMKLEEEEANRKLDGVDGAGDEAAVESGGVGDRDAKESGGADDEDAMESSGAGDKGALESGGAGCEEAKMSSN